MAELVNKEKSEHFVPASQQQLLLQREQLPVAAETDWAEQGQRH
jgi:hypothetical protein